MAAAHGATKAESVEFQAGDIKLNGILFRPTGAGPFPAIVALHACGGLTKNGQFRARYQDWADALTAAGYVVLFPDSFGPRGLGSQCRAHERPVRASRLRVIDADAARHWLQAQSYVVPGRISLLGWSHGGTSVLWAVRRHAAQQRNRAPDFRSAVAFYPSCRRSGVTAWSARIPTLILIGKADDWEHAGDCAQMLAGARGRSAAANLVTYPGAYHDFDRANDPVHERVGIANTAEPSGRVHVGTQPEARADAFKRVPEWFAR
ncbi:MAG TPA: dienelactone hydrolase family protein [Pseudolabrys sp.]|nr:dienelactone hydrolase family protein [Pseudolabrys sp.]